MRPDLYFGQPDLAGLFDLASNSGYVDKNAVLKSQFSKPSLGLNFFKAGRDANDSLNNCS